MGAEAQMNADEDPVTRPTRRRHDLQPYEHITVPRPPWHADPNRVMLRRIRGLIIGEALNFCCEGRSYHVHRTATGLYNFRRVGCRAAINLRPNQLDGDLSAIIAQVDTLQQDNLIVGIRAASTLTGVSYERIRQAILDGRIVAHSNARQRHINRDSLLAWVRGLSSA